jgi:hypothetical protein
LATPKPILKGGVRILRPSEYGRLRVATAAKRRKRLDNATKLDALLLTGLRYVEAQRLQQHPEWFDGKFIHLPEFAQKKAKRKQRERWIRLSSMGIAILPYFFKVKPLPSWKAWTLNLRRWAVYAGLDPAGLSPKTTRKTWESWLVASYPEHIAEVCLSQGHTQATSLQFYLNMPFTEVDKLEAKKWIEGWI